MNNIKELIIEGLNNANIDLAKRTPKTKKVLIEVDLTFVKPNEMYTFMRDNNIPDDAFFSTNGDIFSPILSFYEDMVTNDNDKLDFNIGLFPKLAYTEILRLLTENNYKFFNINSYSLMEFSNTTVYEMFVEKQYDRLIRFYSHKLSLDIKLK